LTKECEFTAAAFGAVAATTLLPKQLGERQRAWVYLRGDALERFDSLMSDPARSSISATFDPLVAGSTPARPTIKTTTYLTLLFSLRCLREFCVSLNRR
jgi:hypothetical protein